MHACMQKKKEIVCNINKETYLLWSLDICALIHKIQKIIIFFTTVVKIALKSFAKT